MARLIDADTLKKLKVYSEERREYIVSVYNIDNAPTVEERPHGKWVKEDKPHGGFGDFVLVNTCPFCKESFVYHGNNPKFCSECGADMRGGQGNDPN